MVRIELSSPNLQEAARSGGPVEVFDPATGQTFVLVSAEQYQKMCEVLAGELDPREAYPMIDRVMAEDDAEDPLLESYQS